MLSKTFMILCAIIAGNIEPVFILSQLNPNPAENVKRNILNPSPKLSTPNR